MLQRAKWLAVAADLASPLALCIWEPLYTNRSVRDRNANVIDPADYPYYLLSTTAGDGNSNLDRLRDMQRLQSLSEPQ